MLMRISSHAGCTHLSWNTGVLCVWPTSWVHIHYVAVPLHNWLSLPGSVVTLNFTALCPSKTSKVVSEEKKPFQRGMKVPHSWGGARGKKRRGRKKWGVALSFLSWANSGVRWAVGGWKEMREGWGRLGDLGLCWQMVGSATLASLSEC